MLYLYDDAIADDIKASFAVEPDETPPIRVVSPDAAINLAAQIQGDEITVTDIESRYTNAK